MAKWLGIDVGGESVRVVLVRSSYRKLAVEAIGEHDLATVPTLADAIRAAAGPLATQGDSVAIAIEGERTFVRSLELPPTALRQLGDVLPYELEAQLPVELDQTVYDHLVRRRESNDAPVRVLAVAARIDDVRARVDLVKEALAIEPERVGCGGFPLAALVGFVPELAAAGPIGVLDLGETRSELVVFEKGEPAFSRTVGRGTAGLPGSAPPLARELRQSIAAWRATGGAPLERIHLAGPGAGASGAEAFLQAELGIEVTPLPSPRVEPMPPEQLAQMPRFAKALGLALSLAPRAKTMNLRRGPLAYERGYGFLREKVPILSGLAAVIAVSFLFSTWAESRALSREKETLASALGQLSQQVLGEETTDPKRAMELLDRGPGGPDEDPLPHADAFDVMVELSKAVPDTMTHDVEELDVQRGHVTIHGIVPTIPDAQQIAGALKAYKCFQDVKIVRTNQVVGEDKQKYALELDIKCPTEGKGDKKASPASSGSASPPSQGDRP